MSWRWAQEAQRSRREELERRKSAWPHEPAFEDVRKRVLAALRVWGPADLSDFEDAAVVATRLERCVVSDALWLMIDLQDLTQTGAGTTRFSIRPDEEEK